MRFKVWDAQKGKWFKEINDAQNGRIEQMVLFQKGFLVLRLNDKMILCEQTWPGRFHRVMGTTIPDMRGKEIFLGDILRIRGMKSLCRVILLRGMFCVSPLGTEDAFPLSEHSKMAKIIGNQYQLPKLLNTKTNLNGTSN